MVVAVVVAAARLPARWVPELVLHQQKGFPAAAAVLVAVVVVPQAPLRPLLVLVIPAVPPSPARQVLETLPEKARYRPRHSAMFLGLCAASHVRHARSACASACPCCAPCLLPP